MIGKDPSPVQPWQLPDMKETAVNASQRPPPRQPGEPRGNTALVTAEMLQQLREQARHEGYEEGLKNGHRDGLAQGLAEGRSKVDAEILQLRTRVDAMLEALARPLQMVDDQAEQALAQLAMSVARQLIRRELRSSPGQIVAVVREAVQLLPMSRQTIRVFLHPEDAALVREVFALDARGEHTWQVLDDPGQSRGGCRVLTDDSTIDASLESRIAAIVTHVLGGERSEDERGAERATPVPPTA
ncbi:flagellar assembly protein FliH [Permianibacter sp. IMCC34836]|uniref:flagellar assembly protein FliH n=1 Tax=Permianibacter fluminis TaxID=2738515 RepID=UPI001557D777|nr:flagellar assembly protein FliH [Permianibacter fluminis]NQD38037.1 flagellar assembly protein FliH [Permianibacter fluminis]